MENIDYVVAIDLGTNTVSAVAGYRNADGSINVVDCVTAEVQGMVRSEIKNIEQVVCGIKEVVTSLENRLGIKVRDVYTGISGQHIRCVKYPYYVFVGRDGEIREDDVRKLHESMSNVQAPDGEAIIQIMPQSYLVDDEETSSPVGAFGNKLEATFNFILGDSNAVSRLKRALSRVELKQTGLFVNAIASAEAVATADEKDEGVAVVDMGGGMTDITVFHKNIIRHVAIVPMGGNVINKDIRSYGILERHVENLKVKYGSAMREKVQADKYITTPGLNARVPKEISFQNLAAIIEARMLDIIDFVMAEINASGYKDKLGAGVILTGGCSQLKDLDTLFKSHTGLDVRVASPEISENSHADAKNPVYATAVGILIKGIGDGGVNNTVRKEVQPNTGFTARVQNPVDPFTEEEQPVRRTINDIYGHSQSSDEYDADDAADDTADAPKKRGGLFSKWKDKFNNMFDVIEDNEI